MKGGFGGRIFRLAAAFFGGRVFRPGETMIRAWIIVAVCVVASAAAAAAWQQRDSTITPRITSGSSTLAGRVMSEAAMPQPIRRATVRLEGEAGTSVRHIGTDDEGRFVFDRLPAGRYTVSATKPGWVTTFHGGAVPGRGPGIPVAVAEGARVDLELSLLPGAVITGFITDAYARPATGVAVAAVNVRGGGALPARAVTDDRGVYRIFGLPPGEYAVSALPRLQPASEGRGGPSMGAVYEVSEAELQWARAGGGAGREGGGPAPGRLLSYAPVFFPGTTDASAAATVKVASGEERSDVNLALTLLPMARVSGRLLDKNGAAVTPAQVMLYPRRGDREMPVDVLVSSGALVMPRATVNSSGFTFTGVAPGDYTLVARTGAGTRGTAPPPENAPATLWNVTDLRVDGVDRSDVHLTLLPGPAVSGTMAFEGSTLAPPTDRSSIQITFQPVQPLPGITASPRAVMRPEGTFRFAGVPPGTFVIRGQPPAAAAGPKWVLKSAMLNDRDLADRPFVASPAEVEFQNMTITFTDRPSQVSGRLIDESGQPVTRYSIVVFTTDKTLWLPGARRIIHVRPATDGAFTVDGLPSGDYAIAAAENLDPADLAVPAFLEQLLAASHRVTLADGERKVQDLRVK